jgi:hypothetical protein
VNAASEFGSIGTRMNGNAAAVFPVFDDPQ